MQSIKKHITECHPDETPTSLWNLNRKKIKKPKVAVMQTKKFAARRRRTTRGHDPVPVQQTDRPDRRGHLYYCTKCFSKIEKGNGNHSWDLTCRQRLQKQAKKDQKYCRIKSAWWIRLQSKRPVFAANLAAAVGSSFAEISAVFAVSH